MSVSTATKKITDAITRPAISNASWARVRVLDRAVEVSVITNSPTQKHVMPEKVSLNRPSSLVKLFCHFLEQIGPITDLIRRGINYLELGMFSRAPATAVFVNEFNGLQGLTDR